VLPLRDDQPEAFTWTANAGWAILAGRKESVLEATRARPAASRPTMIGWFRPDSRLADSRLADHPVPAEVAAFARREAGSGATIGTSA